MYSGSEYNDLISLSSKVIRAPDVVVNDFLTNENNDGSKRKVFDAIRFPPVPTVTLPGEVYKNAYEQDFELRNSFKKQCPEDDESMAALDFLENMLLSTVEKVADIRSSVIENGSYVYSLSRSPTAEETEYMKTVIMENLVTLHEESMSLMAEMETFQPDSVDEMLYSESASSNTVIQRLRASLLERANFLKNEIAESALVVDGLTHYSNSIICLPTEKVCRLDGIYIDWSMPHKLQDKVRASNRSLNFADFMRSHGFPVCNDIYSYLQSTKSHGNVLSICGYRFRPGELKTALEFFDLQHEKSSHRLAGSDFLSIYQSVKFLVLDHCELSDRDCHAISTKLTLFKNLLSLSMRSNRITYSGVASLSSVVFENGSNLRCLRLDNNLIRSDGALFIAQVLHKLPFLEILSLSGNPIRDKGVYFLLKYSLNPLRSCANKLHKPSVRWTAAVDGSNLEDDEDEEEGATVGDENGSAVDGAADLTPQQRFLRRKIQRRCYFDDYFRAHFSKPKTGNYILEGEEDEMAFGIAQREREQWINKEDDEFNMDVKSEYSDTDGEDENTPNIARLSISSPWPADASVSNVSMTLPSTAELDSLAVKRLAAYGHSTKLIQMMMKLRVRLVAINAFTRMLRTGGVLTSLSVADCKLTGDIVPTIVQALTDNKNILTLDASHNPNLLVSVNSCIAMAQLLERGGLHTVLLNSCGVNDRGFMELTRGASNSRTVKSLELSGNRVGPTGANWAATANKVFFMDTLTIAGGYHASAPFKKKGDPSLSSVFDEEEESRNAGSVRAGSDEGKAQAEDYLSDGIESYVDTDLFDGEDYEGYEDELNDHEDSLELSEEEMYQDGNEDAGTEAYPEEDESYAGGGGDTVVSRVSRVSRASHTSRGGSIVSAAIKGVAGVVKHGLSHARGRGTASEAGDGVSAVK
jgi:hypothetical protein